MKRRIQSCAATPDHNAREDLDSLLVAFYHASVNSDCIADFEWRDVQLQLLFLNLLNNVHTMLAAPERMQLLTQESEKATQKDLSG